MKLWKDDRGFFLVEALLMSLLLMALSGVFAMYQLSERMHADNRAHVAAVFLAQEEMSYLMEQGSKGRLRPGELPWLGADGANFLNGKEYEARADIVAADGDGFCRAQVTVAWEQNGKKRRVVFERLVRNLGTKGGGRE